MPLLIEHITTPTDQARVLIEELERELSGPHFRARNIQEFL